MHIAKYILNAELLFVIKYFCKDTLNAFHTFLLFELHRKKGSVHIF